jgi:hypothetical protein
MDTQKMVVEVCQNVLSEIAKTHQIEAQKVHLRIDTEDLKSKPVFGIFNERTFICPKTMSGIIELGGGKGMGLVIGMYLKNIIGELFKGFMQHLSETDTKNICIVLHHNSDAEESFPVLSIFHFGKRIDCIRVSEILELQNKEP